MAQSLGRGGLVFAAAAALLLSLHTPARADVKKLSVGVNGLACPS